MRDSSRDNIYVSPLPAISGFRFDEEVVNVFPDMIKRSVPGYETIIAMTGTLAGKYARDGSNCYDLGSSLGASTLAMARNTADRNVKIIAVDNSTAMIGRCRAMLEQMDVGGDIELICDDILNITPVNASLAVLNFTLQFIPVDRRRELIDTIYRGLRPGGVLVLSEKICFADPHLNQLMIDLHHSFKRANGYSDLEISQKRDALENVLVPETLAEHRERLHRAGFSSVDVWFQCFNFASLIAIKEPG